MIKKAIITAVVLVILLSAVLLVFSNQVKNNPLNISTNNDTDSSNSAINQDQGTSAAGDTSNDEVTQNNSKSTNNPKVKISAAEAKKIAQKSIEEPGMIAGTPKLTKVDGKYEYIVPILKNGKVVGDISVDPQTGKTGKA